MIAPGESELVEVFRAISAASDDATSGLHLDGLRNLLMSGKYREEQSGRYHVALSLAEAATVRKIIHSRLGDAVIDGMDTAAALRALPAGNIVLDATEGYAEAGTYMNETEHQCMRFLNSEMHYSEPQLSITLRALQGSRERERRMFFTRVITCRRRLQQKWQDTPVAKLFTIADEWHALRHRAQSAFLREAVLNVKKMRVSDAFTFFDADRNGCVLCSHHRSHQHECQSHFINAASPIFF